MFKKLHHKLDEDDAALTVLGVPDDLEQFWSADEVSGSLGDVGQRVRDMAGGNDTTLVSMYSVYPGPGGPLEFLAVELLPLRQAIQRLNQIHGGDDAPAELSVLEGSEEMEDAEEGASPAFAHLREAVHRLFNRDEGQKLTVLGLLSHPRRHAPPGTPPGTAPRD
jgi:hypothetical protein